MFLDWAVLAESFFNTISLLWLGWMVLLAGNRRSPGTWLTGGGLLLGALFFTSHTAILGRGLDSASMGMDFWWGMSWMPAVTAPLAWYCALLWYSGYRLNQPHRHHGWVRLVFALAGSIALMLIFANPVPSYEYVTQRILVVTPRIAGIPLLILAYVGYSLLCYLLPLDLLGLARGNNAVETRMRQRARSWLIGASVALLLAGIVLAWTAFWAVTTRPVPSLTNPADERTVKLLDLAVSGLVALAVTLLGRAIVGFEVFTGRPLPRDRFFRQWRSTVILAAGFGAAASWTLSIELRPIYSLMLATFLMTLFYALYSWSSYAEREAYMERLRPFMTSQDLYGRLTAPQRAEAGSPAPAAALFNTLCLDVLEVQQAGLVPAGTLATLAGPPMIFPAGSQISLPPAGVWASAFTRQDRCRPGPEAGAGTDVDWAVPLWSSRGLDGVLFLKEKNSRNPLTEEEIEIAQAAGERLLDLLAGAEMARLAMDLLGQQLARARALDGQGRRALHDEVLPNLHTALLYLNEASTNPAEKQQAMQALANAHREISDLMREMPLPLPHRLAQNGLAAAITSLLEVDFAHQFSSVNLSIQPEAAQKARDLPLYIAEALYFAARELVRNAATHGRGSQNERSLHLEVCFELENGLRLSIEDDGIGPQEPENSVENEPERRRSGSGNGLSIHSAVLAAVGAGLEIAARAEGGTRAVIRVNLPISSHS